MLYMNEIEYIFSAGFRCYSPDTLKTYGLRPFSGPFDYLFIDIDSVFKLINLKMSPFLNDIIVYNKNKQQNYNLSIINDLNEKNVCYMSHDYNNIDLRINVNFLDDKLSGNLYEWDKICIFHHHDICNKEIYDNISKRVDRFNKIMEKHYEKTCLFHITKILTIDIQEYIDNIIRLKLLYSIPCYITIIVCCDNLEDTCYFKCNILFIVKKVAPYSKQIVEGYGTDNNLDYTHEINIMKQIFNFQLVSLSDTF